jgi:uncharacterized damage-inducible protein DinB
MTAEALSLSSVFEGWDSHHTSLVNAIAPLTATLLAYRPAPHLRPVGEIANHIAKGRVGWFARMGAPGAAELLKEAEAWDEQDGTVLNAEELVRRLEASWQMVQQTLQQWTVADLARTYRQPYQGKIYAVSHQWTIWRILTHDIHHGGEIAVMLGSQGIDIPELGDQFGHLTEIPVIEEA